MREAAYSTPPSRALTVLQAPAHAWPPQIPTSGITTPAAGTCVTLGGFMGHRATKSGKLFPSGLVAVLSAAMSIGYVRTLM